jgi:hypothetical protein
MNLAQNQAKLHNPRQNNPQLIYRFERHHTPDDLQVIFNHTPLKAQSLLSILIALGKRYHRVFPSLDTLSAMTGFSKTSIVRYIQILETYGLINVLRDTNKKRKRKDSNIYILNPVLLSKNFSNIVYAFCIRAYQMTIRDFSGFSKTALVRMWTLYNNFIKGIKYLRSSKEIFERLFLRTPPSRDGVEEEKRYVYEKIDEEGEETKNLQREETTTTQETLSTNVQAAIDAMTRGVPIYRDAYSKAGFSVSEIQHRINAYLFKYLSVLTDVERLTLRKKGFAV